MNLLQTFRNPIGLISMNFYVFFCFFVFSGRCLNERLHFLQHSNRFINKASKNDDEQSFRCLNGCLRPTEAPFSLTRPATLTLRIDAYANNHHTLTFFFSPFCSFISIAFKNSSPLSPPWLPEWLLRDISVALSLFVLSR